MNQTDRERIVGGYQFGSEKDAKLAQLEEKKIGQLEGRMKYEDEFQVKVVYEKAIENRVFQTPAGLSYLKKLQKFLLESGYDEKEILPIPVYTNFTQVTKTEETYLRPVIKPSTKKMNRMQNQYRGAKILIGILVIVILIMFIITINGKNPNIINYENALVDKYAAWEQELSERESAVRQKEQELGLTKE